MCLILFAYRQHPDYPLILIANRDEYYARPTRDAHWWDETDILAGRDLEAGGTWLGVNRRGNFAAVTNVREAGGMKPGKRSRGELTRAFLEGNLETRDYLAQLQTSARDYAGFNLLLGNAESLWFYSNRGQQSMPVEAGVYGISNGGFDEDWPKLSSGRAELAALLDSTIDEKSLMEILTDHQIVEDHRLPSTGVPVDVERLLSSRFIRSGEYGTRACSLLLFDNEGRISFREQNFIDAEQHGALVREDFRLS